MRWSGKRQMRARNCKLEAAAYAPDGSIVQPQLMWLASEAAASAAAAEAQAAEEGGKELQGQLTDCAPACNALPNIHIKLA